MQTITLKIADDVSEKFLWFLEHFSRNEIEILESTIFENNVEYLAIKNKLMESQEPTLAKGWDNHYDEVWNEL